MEQNHFLPVPSDVFYSYFNACEEYKQCFDSNCYESNPRLGYWQKFVEMGSARQSSLIAIGKGNNTNTSQAKLWAENHAML